MMSNGFVKGGKLNWIRNAVHLHYAIQIDEVSRLLSTRFFFINFVLLAIKSDNNEMKLWKNAFEGRRRGWQNVSMWTHRWSLPNYWLDFIWPKYSFSFGKKFSLKVKFLIEATRRSIERGKTQNLLDLMGTQNKLPASRGWDNDIHVANIMTATPNFNRVSS